MEKVIRLGMIVMFALMKALMCVTGSETPIMVVSSGSMEPDFKRGDVLFLYTSKDPIRAGEIVVYKVDGRKIPIVHRVIEVHERTDGTGEVDYLTKGDNNHGDDRPLYAHGQLWLQRHHVIGKAATVFTLCWQGDNYLERKAYYSLYSNWRIRVAGNNIKGLTEANTRVVNLQTNRSSFADALIHPLNL